MAERRMFAKTIIDSDAFLDMPLSAQALYFHLSMRADDDGFVNNPKRIQRTIGGSDDDYKILLVKNFIIAFDSGVIVIKHWKIHNYIRGDRKKDTAYPEEMSLLSTKGNGAYTLLLNNMGAEGIECILDSKELRKKAYEESDLPYSFDYKIRNAFYGRRCPVCGIEMRGFVDECGIASDMHRPTIQHNMPISKGGKHELGNISVICHQCNVSIQDNETDRLNADEVIAVWDSLSDDGQTPVKCQSDGSIGKDRLGKDRLGKDRLGKDRLGKNSIGNTSCGEPEAAPLKETEPVFIKIPLVDKTDFDVTESMVADYKQSYPAVDVEQQLRNMRRWCIDNPTRKKTRAGIMRFIGNWLQKEQDRGGTQTPRSNAERLKDL